MRDREAGFTLIELMVAVAVVSILAVIALPSFFGETRKAKAMAEVQPMFSDLRVRFEQYVQEQGAYPATIGETTLYPGAPSTTPMPLTSLPTDWQKLKVRFSGPDQVRCGYTWVTGLANQSGNIGTIAGAKPPQGFGFTAPETNWYYLLAKCDMDGTGSGDDSTFSWYFTSSVDPTIQKLNEGR
ncbi:MAG TPA: prepilin-type N-terminal cleavage/methylation domain-containing protein [Kofleriaceae bacterium]